MVRADSFNCEHLDGSDFGLGDVCPAYGSGNQANCQADCLATVTDCNSITFHSSDGVCCFKKCTRHTVVSHSVGSIVYYRLKNGGALTWRPAVQEVSFFQDTACTIALSPVITPDSSCAATGCTLCSAWDDIYGNINDKGCQLAFDNAVGTSWRVGNSAASNPTGNSYAAGAVWIGAGFPSDTTVGCATAPGLSRNEGGGIAMELSADGGATWVPVAGDGATTADQFVAPGL